MEQMTNFWLICGINILADFFPFLQVSKLLGDATRHPIEISTVLNSLSVQLALDWD